MKKIIFILLLFSLFGCENKKEEYKELMINNDYVILDVRTRDEYNEEHIVGAINVPVDKINEDIDLDKEKLIFVYCKSGVRSKNAYNILKAFGYNVYDLGSYTKINLEKE